MLYWVAATYIPKNKKDEEQKPEELVLQPEIVVAKGEQAAATKVTIKAAEILASYDLDRINVLVRPF